LAVESDRARSLQDRGGRIHSVRCAGGGADAGSSCVESNPSSLPGCLPRPHGAWAARRSCRRAAEWLVLILLSRKWKRP
jgi:hypothetical protein